MAAAALKVGEYRDLCDELSQAFISLRSAPTAEERSREARWVRRVARELMAAHCPRAKAVDRARAERLIDQTASYLGVTSL
jgi:hypothetical protein